MNTTTALVAGQNAASPERVTVVVSARGAPVLDLCALLLGPDGKVTGDADFVFFNAPEHPSGAVRLRSDCGVELDLRRAPSAIERIVIAVSVEHGSLADLHDLQVNAATHHFEPGRLAGVTSAVLLEFYRRRGAWKVRAVGQGWVNGLVGLVTEHGIVIDEPPRPPVPAPSSTGPAPDWFADPQATEPGVLRWWTGTAWSPETLRELPDTPGVCGRCGSRMKVPGWRHRTVPPCQACEARLARSLAGWRSLAESTLREHGPRSAPFAQLGVELRHRRIAVGNGREVMAGLARDYLTDVVAIAFADNIIEDDEMAGFDADVIALEMAGDPYVSTLRARLTRGQQLGRARDGVLPAVATRLHLDAIEVVHLDCPATHVRFPASGPRKLVGRLVVSSAKLRFVAPTGGTELALTKVIDIVPRYAQVEVLATTARGGGVFEVADVEWVDAVRCGAVRCGAVRCGCAMITGNTDQDGHTMNTTITTHLVAWATTSAAGSWDSHGIAVLPQDRETDENGQVVYRGETGIPVAEVSGDAATDGAVDEDALDAMLASVGYRRTDGWDDTAGDQLCADVEAIG